MIRYGGEGAKPALLCWATLWRQIYIQILWSFMYLFCLFVWMQMSIPVPYYSTVHQWVAPWYDTEERVPNRLCSAGLRSDDKSTFRFCGVSCIFFVCLCGWKWVSLYHIIARCTNRTSPGWASVTEWHRDTIQRRGFQTGYSLLGLRSDNKSTCKFCGA